MLGIGVDMSFSKVFIVFTSLLFLGIGTLAIVKKNRHTPVISQVEEKRLPERVVKPVTPVVSKEPPKVEAPLEPIKQEVKNAKSGEVPAKKVDLVRRFFSKGLDKLPIVETVVYTSRVPWLKGRPAWIADYASYYETSRHFIARSLNNKPDYFTQNVSPGDKFNVFRQDKKIQFYLLVDLSDCTMDFYYLDLDKDERVFLKQYKVGVGRLDSYSPSGSLTPTGKYALGSKVAIYKPGIEHYFQNQKTHMIEVFGTRWLPFEEEIENCSDSARGYGIHGVPCVFDQQKNLLIEQENGTGTYTSDGCLRLAKDDVEELFAIVITKPTIVEIVKKKGEAKLPMSKEIIIE